MPLQILNILHREAIKPIYKLSYLNIRKLTVQKDMDILKEAEERATKFMKGLAYLPDMERLCSAWRTEGSRGMLSVGINTSWRDKGDRLFSVISSDRQVKRQWVQIETQEKHFSL